MTNQPDGLSALAAFNKPGAPTAKEKTDVATLVEMMGGGLGADVALRVLRDNGGNIEKAVSVIFEKGIENLPPPLVDPDEGFARATSPRAHTPPLGVLASKPEKSSVIDLTMDDDDDKELSRALQASLEDQAPHFGPSNRAPDPNWAMVPSNVETSTNLSQEDQSLSRAIEASLQHDVTNDQFEEIPLEERVRKDGRPVALRPSQGTLAHAGLLVHGLFFVPQVRHAIAAWQPENPDDLQAAAGEPGNLDLMLWTLQECWTNMDLALTSELSVDEAIKVFDAEHWSTLLERPGDVSYQFYSRLASTIELAVHPEVVQVPPPHWPRLFHFRYGFSDADLSHAALDRRVDLAVVRVFVQGTDGLNDLVSCLSHELALTGADPAAQQVIFSPSDVVAFHLMRDSSLPSYGAATAPGAGAGEKRTFGYPKSVYLDQFLKENLELANEKRTRQRELNAEIEILLSKKQSLLKYKDRDTLADLRASLHYYENVAEHGEDLQRKAQLQEIAQKLRKILTRIENELQTIDSSVAKVKLEALNVFHCPELQKHRYDLRVVLVHDGLFGRKNIYSYVKFKGKWWKTVDHVVTEVSEDTVLSDPNGLHLGAGPYFLIYSRAVPEEVENARTPWPDNLKNSVKHNNNMFLRTLPPEVGARVADPNSPPSSPILPPSEHSIPSDMVEPPESRAEPMETD